MGVKVVASSFPELVAEAGRSLVALIVENPDAVRLREQRSIECHEEEPLWLLFDFLSSLLLLITNEHFLPRDFIVDMCPLPPFVSSFPSKLLCSGLGEDFKPHRHRLAHDVKAITYHRLDLRKEAGNWVFVYYVDI